MNIVPMKITDESVLKLFSEHDDYMIDFWGNDKWCYTRYNESENIERVWAVSLYRSFGFNIVFQQGLYIQMEKKIQ